MATKYKGNWPPWGDNQDMFEILSNRGYVCGCAKQPLGNDRHQALTKAIGLEAFDYL